MARSVSIAESDRRNVVVFDGVNVLLRGLIVLEL